MDKYTDLAKKSIIYYLNENKVMKAPENLPPEMSEKTAGVFVSLHQNNNLKGCIGTYFATQKNIALEIINNAVSAATQDPRFLPVKIDEVESLDISVDILSQPLPTSDLNELNPKKFGVIIKTSDGRTGLLLPDLEGVNETEQQLMIVCQKAGICYGEEKYEIFKFTVERHH